MLFGGAMAPILCAFGTGYLITMRLERKAELTTMEAANLKATIKWLAPVAIAASTVFLLLRGSA